jgi:hypothetical protein
MGRSDGKVTVGDVNDPDQTFQVDAANRKGGLR